MPLLTNLTSPSFANIAIFGIVLPLPQLLLAPNQVVDPRVFYMKLTALSRRTSTTGQKNSHSPTLWWKQAVCKKLKFPENFHCIWHRSTKWLLAPTFGGPNIFRICSSESWEAELSGAHPDFDFASFILGAIFKSNWTMRFHYTENKAILTTFPT
jgi:hypothetical protein